MKGVIVGVLLAVGARWLWRRLTTALAGPEPLYERDEMRARPYW